MSYADVIGHERVIDLLETESGRPAQAYLFVGPASVGKAALATRFAAELLGVSDERGHRLVMSGNHPDLVLVEPEGAASLGVDQAREVVRRAAMAPVESARTVFLFPEAGAMTDQAANALLKTLEEPLADVVFLLVAESEEDLPMTVASRCRSVQVARVPHEQIVAALTGRGVESDSAEAMALVSGGRPGLALALMTRPEVADFRRTWLGVPSRVTPRPGDGQRLAAEILDALGPLVEEAVDEGMTAERAQRARRRVEMSLIVSGLEILASWYTDAAALQMGGPVRNQDVELATLTNVSPRRAVRCAEMTLDAVIDIQANLRRELVLANLFSALGAEEG